MSAETQHQEVVFESEIVEHLVSNGWWFDHDNSDYDKELALWAPDVLAWLQETQPDEYEKAVPPTLTGATRAQAERTLLERLAKVLNLDPFTNGGTIHVLHKGFDHVGRVGGKKQFRMAQPRPVSGLNSADAARYAAMRLRVARQVHYSTKHPNKSLDLVLFVNGLPVATVELKTDYTQGVDDAVQQFRADRPTAGEKLLSFGHRALVHFAVSNSRVKMTTRLDGKKTWFLPFDKGDDGGAGNPINPSGSATAYLWEEIWDKDTWLDILLGFVSTSVKTEADPDSGEMKTDKSILFPRYHQWRAVTRLATAARDEGPGLKYLVQHSAGSGKSNSIGWLAHKLQSTYRDDDSPMFDKVIIVTDRTVLDSQLGGTVSSLDKAGGVVEHLTRDGGAKSKQLADALHSGSGIVVVTIQSFLPALDLIRTSATLKDKSFAVIADEAHSSQTGTTAGALRNVLTADEQSELADGGTIDTEKYLEAAMQRAAELSNISFFAFTATPKPKTIEMFGTPDPETGIPKPFDLYTMQQAIDEKFILDVLRNYTSYEVAWRLAHPENDFDGTDMVDADKARKSLVSWVRLHPTAIGQKVGVIIDHFRKHVAHHLDGRAKAMVVTASRKEAVRYKAAFDSHIAKLGYKDLKALVAFSGTVDDTGPGGVGEGLTEANMNPGAASDLAKEFARTEYSVMIVANKYQTGFDEKKLVAMYVDKKLDGVQAVQTLSRLNRTMAGKTQTFVLDFVNEPAEILAAFKPYYREAAITDVSDPNQLLDLANKLDGVGIYTPEEVEGFANAWVREEGNNALAKWTQPIVKRFATRLQAARDAENKPASDQLELFKSDMGAFIRYYDFISQILDLGDTDLLRRQLLFRRIHGALATSPDDETVDISQVSLEDYRLERGETLSLPLSEGEPMDPMSVGGGLVREKHRDRLSEIVRRLNERFGDKYSDGAAASVISAILEALSHDAELQGQAAVNGEAQFAESQKVVQSFRRVLLQVRGETAPLIDDIIADPDVLTELEKALPPMLFEALQKAATGHEGES